MDVKRTARESGRARSQELGLHRMGIVPAWRHKVKPGIILKPEIMGIDHPRRRKVLMRGISPSRRNGPVETPVAVHPVVEDVPVPNLCVLRAEKNYILIQLQNKLFSYSLLKYKEMRALKIELLNI